MKTEDIFLNFLNKGGIPYEKKLIQKHSNLVLSILSGRNPPPYELEIQPSARCDAGCLHCFGRTYKHCDEKLYSEKSMERIVEQVLGFEKDGFKVKTIKFCGSTGEPLVNQYTLHAINLIHGKRNQRLFTNGLNLGKNKNNISYLETISKVNELDLSLDCGSTEILWAVKPGAKKKNVFLEDILDSIKKIKFLSKKRGDNLEIDVGYVITNKNYTDVINAATKLKEVGVDVLKFRIDLTDRSVSENHGKEIYKSLLEAQKVSDDNFKVYSVYNREEINSTDSCCFSTRDSNFKCFTSRLWACIGPDAKAYACGHIVNKNTQNYGDLLEEDFQIIWESDKRKKIIESLPEKKCEICSPFSLRANELLTFLSKVGFDESKKLIKNYFLNQNTSHH